MKHFGASQKYCTRRVNYLSIPLKAEYGAAESCAFMCSKDKDCISYAISDNSKCNLFKDVAAPKDSQLVGGNCYLKCY